jgi:hypothetical protein
MSKKAMLVAMVATTALMFAMPGLATAGNWKIHPTPSFVMTSGATAWTFSDGTSLTCTSMTGSGSYTNETEGTMTILRHGCTASGFNCTSTGHSVGTVTFTASFRNVYLSSGKTTPGMTFTGPTGPTSAISTFTCAGLITYTITGSINAHLEKGCNEGKTESTMPIELKSGPSHGEVFWPYVTGDSKTTKDDLTVNRNGSLFTGSIDSTQVIHFASAAGATCV